MYALESNAKVKFWPNFVNHFTQTLVISKYHYVHQKVCKIFLELIKQLRLYTWVNPGLGFFWLTYPCSEPQVTFSG